MTVLERQHLRNERLVYELEQARIRAGTFRVSYTCQRGLAATGSSNPGQAAWHHKACKEEEPGGRGCLCPCHDDHSGVVAGTAVIA